MMNSANSGVPRGPGKVMFLILAILLVLLMLICVSSGYLARMLPGASEATPTVAAEPAATRVAVQPTVPPALPEAPSPAPTAVRSETPTSISTSLPSATPTSTSAPTQTFTPVPMCFVIGQGRVNLRYGPGTAYVPTVGTVRTGDQLVPLAYNRTGFPEPNWLKVRVQATGLSAWIIFNPDWIDCNFDYHGLPEEAPPATPTPTPTPTYTLTPRPTLTPAIRCWVDPGYIQEGQAATLYWDIQNVRGVYLDGEGVPGQGSREVYPKRSQDYTLAIDTEAEVYTCNMTVKVVQRRHEPEVLYDFVANASAAEWGNGSYESLPFPGDLGDARGFVTWWQGNVTLEDGSVPALALETHPQWVDYGWVYGDYTPNITLQPGDRLVLKVGLLQRAGAGSVTFVVSRLVPTECITIYSESSAQECENEDQIHTIEDNYDGQLKEASVDLSKFAGFNGRFRLRVDAGSSSAQDWAAWVIARIERP